MSEREKSIWWMAFIGLICVAFIFGVAIKASNRSLKEADQVIQEADEFIANYERNTDYEFYRQMAAAKEAEKSEQNAMAQEQPETELEKIQVYVNSLTESYVDCTTAQYEDSKKN